jgi:hypothetical protein
MCCGFIKRLEERKRKSFIMSLFTANTKGVLEQIMKLFDPKTYNPYDLYHQKQLIPEISGVYAWYFNYYFDTLFNWASTVNTDFLKIDMEPKVSDGWYLLYIGIAGKKEGRTLRDRIYDEHLKQNSEGSTFRQTLAALLYEQLNLDPRKQLNGDLEEMKLNRWIFDHAKVAWIETDTPEKIEKIMLREYGQYLYFNLQDNRKNPSIKKLKLLRKAWRKGIL